MAEPVLEKHASPKRTMQEIADSFTLIVGDAGVVSLPNPGCVLITMMITGHTMRLYRDVADPNKYILLDSQGMTNAVSRELWFWNETLISLFRPLRNNK